jgi:hypothetical protein
MYRRSLPLVAVLMVSALNCVVVPTLAHYGGEPAAWALEVRRHQADLDAYGDYQSWRETHQRLDALSAERGLPPMPPLNMKPVAPISPDPPPRPSLIEETLTVEFRWAWNADSRVRAKPGEAVIELPVHWPTFALIQGLIIAVGLGVAALTRRPRFPAGSSPR